ncbi:MAG TPA: alkaline phosphatase D family protein [Steroidobacteraceae bacterium]
MPNTSRRQFLALAVALSAAGAWARPRSAQSRIAWREQRDAYPEGVASGDPCADTVILWTRYPSHARTAVKLSVEIAEDPAFKRVIASSVAKASSQSDWTCRVLVGHLTSSTTYWYRFTDQHGAGSRIGRTRTAPADDANYSPRFAFVSCQNVTQGAQNAYRRMIYEDERAAADQQLDFVFHQGDFIYELVWYPEDRPQGMYDRRLRDLIRYANGEKIRDFHVPTTVDDYRTAYRAYLHDPDLQDARARWPFVTMWDNHEFSWLGYQGLQIFEGQTRPAQTRKVAANQAWFEYQPARIYKPSGASLERFDAPRVVDAPISKFDEHGLGQEPNNLAAIGSLRGYRSIRWGRNVELFLTDQHSYRSEDPLLRPEAKALSNEDFPELIPEEAAQILDAGREYAGRQPPAVIRGGREEIVNFRKDSAPQSIFGSEQKHWFFGRLQASTATWKLWGDTQGTLDWRADLQNLPAGVGKTWPGRGYATVASGDHSNAYLERAEIYDLVRARGITGFATISGDRHSFWAGLAASALPPAKFEPVGVAFVAGSISAPGLVEAFEHTLPKDHPLYGLYLVQLPGHPKPQPTVNLLLHHGVRACLEYARTGDAAAARRLSNPELAPHVSFLDLGGHGYAVVRASATELECEFVCIDRPLERSERADGGPLRYRVVHKSLLWKAGERPELTQELLEGSADLSI